MAAATMTLNEVEWRSYAIMADAGQIISTIGSHATFAVRNYLLLSKMRSLNEHMINLLRLFHVPETIKTLELGDPVRIAEMCQNLSKIEQKNVEIITAYGEVNLGYWKKLHKPKIEQLRLSNLELGSHIRAFAHPDYSLMLLTNRDQQHLLESLMNTPEPNEALRRAFTRN